jgi:hypothetical protein
MSLLSKAIFVAAAAIAVNAGGVELRNETRATIKPEPLHCRLYFGCAPLERAERDAAQTE